MFSGNPAGVPPEITANCTGFRVLSGRSESFGFSAECFPASDVYITAQRSFPTVALEKAPLMNIPSETSPVFRDSVRTWVLTGMAIALILGMWNWRTIRRAAVSVVLDRDELVFAATSGNADDVRRALADGADPNRMGQDGLTALMWAAASGDARSMEHLINAGADLRAAAPTGVTALILASQHGKFDAVKLLLDKGVEPTHRTANGPTPLYAAASFGHEHVIALLLKRGADVNARSSQGRTALMVAASQTASTREGIARLLRAGANPNDRDEDGNTAKDEATSAGREDFLELFDAWQGTK
jgi:hypothetical protein